MGCRKQAALEEHGLSCMYLAHDELDSVQVVIITHMSMHVDFN